MTDENTKPIAERVAFLRSLPLEIKEQLSGEEAQTFMYEEEIPEALYEKIKDYIKEE